MSIPSVAEPAPKKNQNVTLDGRGIARAAALVMVFFLLSRITGLLREIVIGAQFGTSAELDAYLAAFRVPDLLFQLVAGGALGSAFIPTFSTYWANSQHEAAWLLFSRVLNLVTLLLLLIASVAAFFALPLVEFVIAPGFSPEQQVLTAQLMRWMLLSTIVFGASGLIMGALNAVQHFLLPAAAPVFYNVTIILSALILTPYMGVYALAFGVVIGAIVHLLVQLPGLWWQRARYSLSLRVSDPGVLEVARLMGPRVLGLFFVQLQFLVNTILASGLAVGSLSALNYGWLLMLLPQGIFAQAIATAVFPTFAAQVSTGQTEILRRTFGQALRMVIFLTIPSAVGLYMLREPVVRALLERGQFSTESTAMVGYALQFYALGLVAHAAVEIAVRAFYALHNTMTPVLAGILAMSLNIGFSLWWVSSLSYGGLALANSVATTIEMVLLLWLLRKPLQGIEGRRLTMTVGRSLLAAGAMAVALWFWVQWAAQFAWPQALNVGHWAPAVGGILLAAGRLCAGLFATQKRRASSGRCPLDPPAMIEPC
ncbi:MAG: murein biosynthesis integral membrane protein MurJ [Caldilineaceae bacterium]|nr:murein biosynthesis integral membrane protein MurJ [Caldilineaceae bacterium]